MTLDSECWWETNLLLENLLFFLNFVLKIQLVPVKMITCSPDRPVTVVFSVK